MRRTAQRQRAAGVTPRLRRANDLLAEARSATLHRYERLTRAFEAIYLCCIDLAAAQQQALAPTGHPLRKLVDTGMLAIDLPDPDAVAITRLLRWCRFEVPVDDEPCTPEAACELAARVVSLTAAWHDAYAQQPPPAAGSEPAPPAPTRRRARTTRRSDDPTDS